MMCMQNFKIEENKIFEANRLLAKILERTRTAIDLIHTGKPIDFFLGIGDVHEISNDVAKAKEYLKEVWEGDKN